MEDLRINAGLINYLSENYGRVRLDYNYIDESNREIFDYYGYTDKDILFTAIVEKGNVEIWGNYLGNPEKDLLHRFKLLEILR